MSTLGFRRSCSAAAILCALGAPPALSQSGPAPASTAANAGADVGVTASRTPQPIQRSGSAITVLPGDEIARTNPTSFVDALRSVPGLDVSETGGPGAVTSVRLRGGNSGQTLVLVDGVRVGDASGVANDFDFSTFIPGAIERIEVLRGPQSALYGSDAMGGVVNIITKRGKGPLQGFASSEFGSYGTIATSGGVFGANGPWSYAISGGWQTTSGFSRYGYRIGRIERLYANPNGFEPDATRRWGGSARIGYDPGTGVRIEVGAIQSNSFSQYDAAFGALPDTPSTSEKRFGQVWGKISVDAFDNRLTNTLQVFANRTDRTLRDVSYFGGIRPSNTFQTRYNYAGDRIGAEYQGDLKLGSFGLLTFGGRIERETAETDQTNLQPAPGARTKTLDRSETTRALFALWQLPVGERIDLSLSGRVDDVVDVATFRTWRATAAYRLPEINTKLRASIGTGGKAPTLYQLYAPIYGNAALRPEESVGADAGFDTDLFGGRGRVSVTAFANRFTNLIDFDTAALRYVNVARARTSGIETTASLDIWPDFVTAKATYTYLRAKDGLTNLTLARRAPHVGQFRLVITPTPKWTIEPVVTLVSERWSSAGEKSRLAPYARLDVRTEYKVDQTWSLHARVENLTNAHYQDVFNYGTTGRAAYGGLKASW